MDIAFEILLLMVSTAMVTPMHELGHYIIVRLLGAKATFHLPKSIHASWYVKSEGQYSTKK